MFAILFSLYATSTVPAPRYITACIDPAAPLTELARDYTFPAPSDAKTRQAFEELKQYFANPTPRGYHNRLTDYRWVESMTVPDLHKAMALGILYAGGPDINLPGSIGYRHNTVASNALADEQAARALSAVVAQDPSQWLAAVAITRIALVSPEPARMQQALSMVKATLDHDPDNIALQLAWHDLLIAQERARESLDFARAHPSDCTAAKHALAESLLLTGDTAAGARLYLDALAHAQPNELHRFRDDMRVAATPAQLNAYDATPDAKKPEWISTFWRYSATSYARSVEARVAEQMIRASYADVHFRRREASLSSDSRNWATDSMHMVPWDTRGVTYVRHGAPLHRLRILKNQCLQPYEAWVYSAEDHPWIVWFKRECQSVVGAPRQDDWRPVFVPPFCGDAWLVRPAPDLETVKRKVENTPDDLDMRDIFTMLSQYDTRYKDLLDYCAKTPLGPPSPAAGLLLTDLYHEGLKLFDGLQWAESAGPQLEERVRLVVAAYEFQDAQHHSELTAVSWIPVSDLGNAQSSASNMRFSYVVADTLLRASRVDATSAVPPRSAGANAIMHNVVTIPNVDVGSATLRVIALDPADTTRGGIRTAPINVQGFTGAQGMSDIVLAVPNVPGVLKRGDISVEPLTGHIIDVGQSFRLFFEVYGATAGEEVKTTVSVSRRDRSTLAQLRSVFPGKVASRTLSFPRKAELDRRGVFIEDMLLSGDLVPGEYDIVVTVKPARGKAFMRHTMLTVIQ